MQSFFTANGHSIVGSPQEADVCIAGVCAAFEADEAVSVEIIRELLDFDGPVHVYGCLTRVSPERIPFETTYPTWDPQTLLSQIVDCPQVRWSDIPLPSRFRRKEDYRVFNRGTQFVGIATGCSFDCSYCPHKLGVGEIQSRPIEDVVLQVRHLIAEQAQTIILTATDTACYGVDIRLSFPELLEAILRLSNQRTSFHIAQFNPEGLFTNMGKMLACCSDERIHDIQLPVQSASPRLLKLMNRRYSPQEVREFVEKLKVRNPRVFLRTDLMVGFPTETIEELEESVDFAMHNFDEIAVYAFELKQRTPVASQDLAAIPVSEVKRRQRYAANRLKRAGKLVHSGGQIRSTLVKSDRTKELMRQAKERGGRI
ncbi:MAG: radical SAM protein [Thermodesulfobacteriota bacterium]